MSNKDKTPFPQDPASLRKRIAELEKKLTEQQKVEEKLRELADLPRRVMEESLLEEKRFAESLIENSAVATFVLDRGHKTVFWNKACEELTGIASTDVIGTSGHWKPFYDNKRPTIADVILDGNIDIIPSLYSKYSISALRPDGIQGEGWYERLNNRRRYILFEAAPVYNSKGELLFAIETLQDITWRKEAEEELEKYRSQLEKLVVERTSELLKVNMELERDIRNRKQAEEALRLSEARFEEAQRVAHIGTWEWDIATGDIYWSNEVYRIFGLTPHEIVPAKWSFLNYVHPDDRENVKQAVAGALEENSQYSIDVRVMRPDGTVSIVHTQGKAYQDEAGKPVMMLGNVQDITERKKMEEEILKIHKLESIGILAGGIAHDFNNLLSAILGNISLARLYVKPGESIHERLAEAGKAASRAIKLSTQLLTYSKGGVPVKKATSVASLVKEAIDFTLRGSNVRGEVSFPDNLWLAEVDEDQIFQVINNIAINAKQAMPAGGTISVLGENIKNEGCILPLAEGKYVKISIKDQGVGIPYEYREKIFDPFFTTKEKGSGLGLATSYSIIKNHDGYLALETGAGKGTTFHIYLPATEKRLQSSKQKAMLFKGKGRLLVMDDEEIIRLVVGKMLEEIGYEADFAEDGEKAIEQYADAMKSGNPFSAVIMDLTVRGGMGGLECVNKLLEIDPEVKAIVSSGYADNPIMSKYRESGFKGIIIKPYEIEDLSEILYKIINNNSHVAWSEERTL